MAVGVRTQDLRKVFNSPPPAAAAGIGARGNAKGSKQPKSQITDSTGVDVYSDRGGSLIAEVAAVAASAGADLSDVHISEPSLENLFLHHTGRSLRD